MTIYSRIVSRSAEHKPMLAILVDPDKADEVFLHRLADLWQNVQPDIVLVGGSLVSSDTGAVIRRLKTMTSAPVVIFPGNGSQLSPDADALLFLSLISGRNPEYLIGQHVNSAVCVRRSGIETIPTGYILIDGGAPTSVQYISGTMPIPRNKTDIAVATAVAGELLGLKLLYLEAGSGALMPVPVDTIRAVKQSVGIPVVVGGGLRSVSDVQSAIDAGADVVVVGTAIEQTPNFAVEIMQLFA